MAAYILEALEGVGGAVLHQGGLVGFDGLSELVLRNVRVAAAGQRPREAIEAG